MGIAVRQKTVPQNSPDKKRKSLLSQKIKDLELQIPGTRLEVLINELYRELEQAGILFNPKTYLSDEWGCPHGVPVIGIPFYLADPELCKLEGKFTGIEAENEAEIMMYLRHESGHALNYAYRFYHTEEWQKIFGKYSRPYRENYRTSPFSARYVRHVPGWYAQKHPDDDFAETFAVWLNPNSNWKKVYAGTPALKKLLYVDRLVRQYGQKLPPITPTKLDKPIQALEMTLDTWYTEGKSISGSRLELNPIIDQDLQRLFPGKRGRNAEDILQANKNSLVRDVNFWTGLDRHILASLLDELILKVNSLGLKIETRQTTARLISASAFLATLATNYQFTGQFVDA